MELIGEREILPQRIAYGAYQNQASVFGKPFSQDWFIIGHQQVREQGGGEMVVQVRSSQESVSP